MKKLVFGFLFSFLLCTSVYANDIVELDSDGHITLVDRIKNTKEKFLPETVQSGVTDSELLNQIIDSSVAKFFSVSSGGWSDVLTDVYDLIGVAGTVIDSATTVTQEAIDKINDWFDLTDDGYIKTSPSWRTDMLHIYNLKAFSEGSSTIGHWLNISGILFSYSGSSIPQQTNMIPAVYSTSTWKNLNLTDIYCARSDGTIVFANLSTGGVYWYLLGNPHFEIGYGNTMRTGSLRSAWFSGGYNYWYIHPTGIDLYNYPSLTDAYNDLLGSPAVSTPGGYNGSMYMNTDSNYNPSIFIRSLPATNWRQVSNDRYNLVGSDPTEESINQTFNSNNPAYTYINPTYNFDIPYALTHGNSTVYDFVLTDDYDFSNIEFSPSEYEIENGVMIVQDVWNASPDKIKAYILAILSLSVAFLFIRS